MGREPQSDPASEAWVQFRILEAWGAHPRIRLWRQNTGFAVIKGRGVRFGTPGCADILGLIRPAGRFLAIECKAAVRGAQSEEQKTFQAMIEGWGGIYILARSLADVDAALADVGVTR